MRTVWVQRTGDAPYVQRHLPTGGVELHFPVGGRPRLLGPLTAARLELLPARTALVGVRYRPGAAPPLPVPLDDLVDRHVDLADLWGSRAERLAEACAGSPGRALAVLQARLPRRAVDPLVTEAVRLLMPPADAAVPGLPGAGPGGRRQPGRARRRRRVRRPGPPEPGVPAPDRAHPAGAARRKRREVRLRPRPLGVLPAVPARFVQEPAAGRP
ncbi:DUF6597 domain-containing transcriptional factor [Amycolatopsis sp. NPDC058278]|uniref:DUF6597 domain-containing transcriptional factor n=1 Tax=Amycolatopsis sp. NPDC058278 TaxID=3346417 RepID=UPI0036DD4C63